jgi:hypothetical protein
MAFEIPDHFHKSFTTNVELLLQQKASPLAAAVMQQAYSGEAAQVVKQFGEVEFAEKAGRGSDTVWSSIEHKQRWIFPTDFELALPVDSQDQLRMLDSPLSPYTEAMRAAWARKMEDVIIAAATGTAYTGKNGSTATAHDTANQQIAAGAAGLTIAKLREALEILDEDFNDEADQKYFVFSAKQRTNLLATTEITSSDYNTVKALVNGQINDFLGFKFIRSERLLLSGSDRRCLAFVKSGLVLGQWNGLDSRIGERADKGYTTQVFMKGTIGATRTQEKKVVDVICVES